MAKPKLNVDGDDGDFFFSPQSLVGVFGADSLTFGTSGADDGEWSDVDIEQESAQEISAALATFKARAAAADQRFVDNTDSEYWICVGFQNRAQKDEFLEKLGLVEMGDKYLDGVLVAKHLGVELSIPTPDMPRFGFDARLGQLSPGLTESY